MVSTAFDWSEVCLVGMGSHAQRRLIPSLQSLINRPITSIVSSQKLDLNFSCIHFTDLKQALLYASPSTLFIIANPPHCHFSCVSMILHAGFDVMVEKPGFLKLHELHELISIALSKNLILIEMFMYLENNITHKLFDVVSSHQEFIKSITINFTLPSLPSNTFRDENTFASSLLLDIGCYPLSFFAYAGLSIENLLYSDISNINKNQTLFKIHGSSDDISLISYVGCTGTYKNSLRIDCFEDKFVEITPFFYGVPSVRNIFSQGDLIDLPTPWYESCSFSQLFSRSRASWLLDQSLRFRMMTLLSAKYQEFSQQFNG